MIQTSGLTAIATSGDGVVTAIENANNDLVHEVTIVNTVAVAGFFSLDGGATPADTSWAYLPAGPCSVTVDLRHKPIVAVLKFKRIASGTDLSGIYAWMV